MSERKDGDAPAPGDPPRRFHMDKNEEVADAQERYRTEPKADAPLDRSASAAASPAAAATPVGVLGGEPRAVALARLATAGAALAVVLAFFYPAFHDALDREHRLVPLGRDGMAAPPEPPPLPPVPRMYLLVNATPRGATVTLDGVEAGSTPLVTNVECLGAPIRVEIAARGYATHVATVACQDGGRADVSPALKRR